MRGRSFAAAISVLSGGIFLAVPAWAQDGIHPADPSVVADASAADAAAADVVRNPFPLRTEFGARNYAYQASGENFFTAANYAATPSYDLTANGPENVTLRDVYMSAEIVPNLKLDLARWNYGPDTYLMDGRSFGLFDNPVIAGTGLRSPFAAFGASGSYIGATVDISKEVSVYFGRMASSLGAASGTLILPLPTNEALQLRSSSPDVETTSVGLDWNVTDWAELGVSASHTQDSPVLGDAVAESVRSSAGSDTVALGISARVGFGEGWVTTVAYSEGVTQLDLNASAATGLDSIRNQSFGFSVAKTGLFGDDALGISVSQPLGIHGGTNFAGLALSSVLNTRSNTLTTRESEFTVGYVTTFMDGALALQANTTYSLNANGEQGQDAVSVLSRAQIKF